MAIGLRRVDFADVPASAKASLTAAGPSQAKRKAAFEAKQAAAGSSQPSGSSSQQRPGHLAHAPTAAEIEEDEVVEVVPEESIDELYTMFNTNVVGVQYYKGGLCLAVGRWRAASAKSRGWQVSLGPGRK